MVLYIKYQDNFNIPKTTDLDVLKRKDSRRKCAVLDIFVIPSEEKCFCSICAMVANLTRAAQAQADYCSAHGKHVTEAQSGQSRGY